MSLLRQYSGFCTVIVLLLTLGGCFSGMLLFFLRKNFLLHERMESLRRTLAILPDPGHPSVQHYEELLRNALRDLRGRLACGKVIGGELPVAAAADGRQVIFLLQDLLDSFRDLCHERGIAIGPKCSFGFDELASGEIAVPEAATATRLLHEQQLLQPILQHLIESSPLKIRLVKKLGLGPAVEDEPLPPGESLACSRFRLVFIGMTPALREFINRITLMALPVFIERVEVSRPKAGVHRRFQDGEGEGKLASGAAGWAQASEFSITLRCGGSPARSRMPAEWLMSRRWEKAPSGPEGIETCDLFTGPIHARLTRKKISALPAVAVAPVAESIPEGNYRVAGYVELPAGSREGSPRVILGRKDGGALLQGQAGSHFPEAGIRILSCGHGGLKGPEAVIFDELGSREVSLTPQGGRTEDLPEETAAKEAGG